jgi:translocation and assembly module TamB
MECEKSSKLVLRPRGNSNVTSRYRSRSTCPGARVTNRLQRVFGVSQLKIDPTFVSGSELPQAQLTLQQQIASNLTFNYVTSLDDANAQTVRVEWVLSPQWSAMAARDQNGIVSVNLL